MSAPWYKCYPRDFNEGMVGLTLEERGAYITILNLIYSRGAPIPEDGWWITSQLSCTTRVWTRLRAALIVKRKLYELQIDGQPHLMNTRAATEIAERREVSEKFSEAGARGGRNSTSKRNKNNEVEQARLKPGSSQAQAISDTETDIPPTPLEGGQEASTRRKPRRAIPENFPTSELIDQEQVKARTVGADIDITAEAERFRNHALANDRRCSDWTAAWRNWVLKAVEWAPKQPVSRPTEEADPWPRRMLGYRVNGYWNSEWGPKPGKPGCLAPMEQAA